MTETVTDEQAEAVRQAVIARYKWWFEPTDGMKPLGKPEDVTIRRDEDGHALISWEEGPDNWAHQVCDGGSTEEERVEFAQLREEFGGDMKPAEPEPVAFPADVWVEPYYSFVLGVYPA